MRLFSSIGLSVLLLSPSSYALVLAAPISSFSQRCSNLCMSFVRDATLSTSCQQICDALQAQEEEPCIQALTNTTDEQLTLMSYSSGHYIETASILAHVTDEANPDYLSFVQHLRLNDRGSPQACHSLDAVHYCLVRDPSMSLGLCLPDICDAASVTEILANISITPSDSSDGLVDDNLNGFDETPTRQPSFAVVCGEESRLDADAGTVLALLFVCFLFSLTVAGTLLDFRKEARVITHLQRHSVAGETKPEAGVHAPPNESMAPLGPENATRASEGGEVQQGASDMLRDSAEDETPIVDVETRTQKDESTGTTMGDMSSSRYGAGGALESNDSALREPLLDSTASRGEAHVYSPPWLAQCLLCFSLRKNIRKLLAPPSSSNVFGALDGIRTLSNLWVILFHFSFFSVTGPAGGLTNAVDVIPLDGHGALSSVPAQVIHQATLAVDTFFLISGFLASVTLLPLLPRVQSGSRSISSWVLGRYWHRYLRLMPTMAFITLVTWQLFPLVSDGPTWWPYAKALKNSCRRDWWTEITFVQNLVPWPLRTVACVGVAWSLGVEMQFFLVGVPLIVLFHYHPRTSVATLLSIMSASCILTLWFGFYEDLRFPLLHSALGDPNSSEDFAEVYNFPWFRCPPYIIGVLCGMAWHKYARGFEGKTTDDSLAAFSRSLVPVGFTTSALLMSLPVFGAYWANRDVMEVQIPMWADHLYLAFSRPAFASGVALLCGLCFCGRGGVVNWFLSLPAWSPLSRLTFCSYLVHPLPLSWLLVTRSVPYRYTTFEVIIAFLGIAGVAFISASVMHLLVEAPFRNLESWARKRSSRKTSGQ